jgi:hypothetical protein
VAPACRALSGSAASRTRPAENRPPVNVPTQVAAMPLPLHLVTVAVPRSACPRATQNGSALTQPKKPANSASSSSAARPTAGERVVGLRCTRGL